MATWFISDLHLNANQPALIQQASDFLQQLPHNTDALYILGDLFEYWVGDDSLNTVYTVAFQSVFYSLQQLKQRGVKLYFQHGNRDFIIGQNFAEYTGVILLPESLVIDLYGIPSLIMHGDTLCTDDLAYQQARRLLRNPQWQQQALSQPIEARIQQALAMRAQSQDHQMQAETIVDVNQAAVIQAMQQAQVSRLIHGHTHRPAHHKFLLEGQPVERLVLGDWHINRPSFLKIDEQHLTLIF
jgi:UDP-2,3-diacylglucosamine hydrolase